MTIARTLVRRSRTPFGSDAAYLTPSGIDVDSTQNYEVVRRKVFFDDIYLVTLHRERGLAYVLTTALFGAGFLGFAILLLAIDTDTWPFALPFLLIGLAALIAFLIRVAMGRDVITIMGRRSRAVIRFGSLSKDRGRESYGMICSAVRRGQTAMPEAPPAEEREIPPDVLPPDMAPQDAVPPETTTPDAAT